MDHTAQRQEAREAMEHLRQKAMAQKGERGQGYLLIHESETRQQRRARECEERKVSKKTQTNGVLA